MPSEIMDDRGVVQALIVIGFDASGKYRLQSPLNPMAILTELERWKVMVLSNLPEPKAPSLVERVTAGVIPTSRNRN